MSNPSSRLINRLMLERAVEFHGHLGPYLVLGLLMGRLATGRYKFRKYFGTTVEIRGAERPPKSCLIDGIQFTSGCTYGKGNVTKAKGRKVTAIFRDPASGRELRISVRPELVKRLGCLRGQPDCDRFANELLAADPAELFEISSVGPARDGKAD